MREILLTIVETSPNMLDESNHRFIIRPTADGVDIRLERDPVVAADRSAPVDLKLRYPGSGLANTIVLRVGYADE